MAIQISGTTVIDNSRNLTNIASIFSCTGIASQAEAEAGTSSTKLMTPQRVAQAISALSGGSVINRIQRGSTLVAGSTSNAPWLNTTLAPYARGTSPVPITSVDTSKSFMSSSAVGAGNRVSDPGSTVGGLTGSGSAALTSSTEVTVYAPGGIPGVVGYPVPLGGINKPSMAAGNHQIEWEVIEFT